MTNTDDFSAFQHVTNQQPKTICGEKKSHRVTVHDGYKHQLFFPSQPHPHTYPHPHLYPPGGVYLTSRPHRLRLRLALRLPPQQTQVDDACLDIQESSPDNDRQDAEHDDERDDDADVVLHLQVAGSIMVAG